MVYRNTVILVLIVLNTGNNFVKSLDFPCEINESTELHLNQKQPNGSYIVDNTLIPKELTFAIKDNKTNITTIYGCICSIKTCLPWCCLKLNESFRNLICTEQTYDRIINDTLITLVRDDETMVENLDFRQTFYLKKDKKINCDTGMTYAFNPRQEIYDIWGVHENSSLRILDDKGNAVYAPPEDYCFSLSVFKEENKEYYEIQPHICINPSRDQPRHITFAIIFVMSQPFMIITIIVYLTISKLRNLHGKALVCHLSSLSISYFCLAYILLGNHSDYFTVCTVVGYICYFASMSAYFWLSIISFDLWFNFNRYEKAKSSQKFRFQIYCAICYGTAMVYVILACIVQLTVDDNNIKPGMGSTYCYLNVESGYSAVIWLYFPLMCVITFNIIMFVLTWRNINSVISELNRFTDKGNSQRSIRNERNNFHIFLRLFVIMGVSWITEIISYFIGTGYQEYFYATDFFNAMQGLLIFILFVCKKDTRKLIAETWMNCCQGSEESQFRFVSKRTRKWISRFKKDKFNDISLATQSTEIS